MKTIEHKLRSGRTLTATTAPIKFALPLAQAVGKLMITWRKGEDVEAGLIGLMLFADEGLRKLVFDCAASAMYDGRKVTIELLDDAKIGDDARGDLPEIISVIGLHNVASFFPQAFSASSVPQAVADAQK